MIRYPIQYLTGLLLLAALYMHAPAFAEVAPAPGAVQPAAVAPETPRSEVPFTPALSYGDRVVSEDTVWRGEILVEGAVTIAPQATLTIEPGTVVRFRQKESRAALLVVQGRLAAVGTREAPVIFSSGFAVPVAGDWQGVMLLGSEKKNVMEYCRIDGAQTGLEALFSNVTLKSVRVERSKTGMRFQDALVVMESGGASGCDTGLSFTESEATLRSPNLMGNRQGLSALRSSIYMEDGSLAANRSAFTCDSCRVKIQGGAVLDNGRGVTFFECQGSVTGVKLAQNNDYGMSLTASRIRVSGNQITGNVHNGLLVFDGASVAWGNAIHGNGSYDLYNAGKEEFRAPGNWWGETAPKIYDNGGLGTVLSAPRLAAPPMPPLQ